ncbi:MAG TPA: hypothetical protein VH333_13895 [Pseudonocardiaceae bacterium]|jgi:hypothetical protein|nr:hypothetical protein [Pseudonocardiaceae bacterium]
MRLRTALGVGVVLVAVVGAVVVLRVDNQQQPAGPNPGDQASTASTVDARARQLTAAFGRTTLLPPTVRIAADPDNPPGFVFQRYDIESAPGIRPVRYTAQGSLVRRADNAALAHVLVIVQQANPATGFGSCYSTGATNGPSCTEKVFPDGTRATVVRNPEFARSAASDATTGQPFGLETELAAAYPTGTTMTVTLSSENGAGIPLDDAAMLRLATIPGIGTR